MYLYNTTFVITDSEYAWWAAWMKRTYLPTIAELAPAAQNSLFRIEGSPQSVNSLSFSCQWLCSTLQELGTIDRYSKALHLDLTKQKGELCLTFSTMMQSVEL